MGAFINGQLALSLKVDGTEIPLGSGPKLQVYINQSCRQMLPASRLEIPDFSNIFGTQVPINDGSLIELNMNDDQQLAHPNSTIFRTFGTPHRKPFQQFMTYSVIGLLDATSYIRGNPPNAIKGSSTDVLKTIATKMNFTFIDSLNTNDNMTWRPGRETWGSFAGQTARHGWIGEQSALLHSVDERRQLRYVDVNDLFANAPIKAHIIYGGNNSNNSNISSNLPRYFANSYKAVNRSGMLNNWLALGHRMTQANILGGSNDRFAAIKGMTINNSLDISKTSLQQINGMARIDLPPLNTGNTHDNFIKARHQNMRGLATYSQNVYVLMPMTTGLNLFDMVEFEVAAAGFTDKSTSGIYSITNMTRAIINSRYYEKIELTASGPQSDNADLTGITAPTTRQQAVAGASSGVGAIIESAF